MCGERFNISYHRGMAIYTREHTCPNCGERFPEVVLMPRQERKARGIETPTDVIMDSKGESPFKTMPEGPSKTP